MLWTLLLALMMQLAPAAPDAAVLLPSAPLVDSVAVAAGATDAPFQVQFGGVNSEYRVMAMFVLPGQRVPIAAAPNAAPATVGATPLAPAVAYELHADSGTS